MIINGDFNEAQQAYKPIEEIINNIYDTVEITKIIKPIYNFKSNQSKNTYLGVDTLYKKLNT